MQEVLREVDYILEERKRGYYIEYPVRIEGEMVSFLAYPIRMMHKTNFVVPVNIPFFPEENILHPSEKEMDPAYKNETIYEILLNKFPPYSEKPEPFMLPLSYREVEAIGIAIKWQRGVSKQEYSKNRDFPGQLESTKKLIEVFLDLHDRFIGAGGRENREFKQEFEEALRFIEELM